MGEFEKNFPNDASLSLKRIDTYFSEEKWDELGKAISALNEAVGHDAYRDLLRANVWLAHGDEGGSGSDAVALCFNWVVGEEFETLQAAHRVVEALSHSLSISLGLR